jgi:hypothetical protein
MTVDVVGNSRIVTAAFHCSGCRDYWHMCHVHQGLEHGPELTLFHVCGMPAVAVLYRVFVSAQCCNVSQVFVALS